MTTDVAAASLSILRLTRGHVERRGRKWFNRYQAECVDPVSGEVVRRQLRMELGEFRSAKAAGEELDRYLAIQNAETLLPGPTITAEQYFARFDRLAIALMRSQSRRVFRGTIRKHLAPALGDKPLVSIDAAALQELVATLHERGLSRATIDSIISRLRQILRHARAAGYSAHAIPRSAIKLPSEQRAQRERRHISAEELARILGASRNPQRALWAILGLSGLRIGEALGLCWCHVDLAEATLYVRQAATAGEIAPLKTRTARRDVPMLPDLVTILTEFRGYHQGSDAELLFATRTGRPQRSGDIRERWLAPLLKQLGLKHAGCHAFRHGLPGQLDSLGLSPAAIQRFMGHSTLAMTEHYTHRSTNDLREQLAAALQRRADPRVSP